MPQNSNNGYDFFIAHAGKDKDQAVILYELLIKDYSVFLDAASLQPGDQWAQVLSDALNKSRIIALLLSRNNQSAYYLQEELARAIQLYRSNTNFYNVIPIYLEGFPSDITEIPYGLYQIHSIDFREVKNFENLATKLIKCLGLLTKDGEKSFQVKEDLHFFHALHEYPVGPMVDGSLVPPELIYAFAEFVDVIESLQVIDEANAFRKQADPHEKGSITIKKINLPTPTKNSPKEFWLAAFAQARLHGPRMLAALLLSVQDTFFPAEVKQAKTHLLNELRTYTS